MFVSLVCTIDVTGYVDVPVGLSVWLDGVG